MLEDEAALLEALASRLAREGFIPQLARSTSEAWSAFDALTPDLVLVDLLSADSTRIDLCRDLRRRSDIPIIAVSTTSSEIDVVVALEVGADDYLVKPYRMRELVARIRAALRRRSPPDASGRQPTHSVGDVRLDPSRHEVTLRGRPVRLTVKEFNILEALLTRAGHAVSKEELISWAWTPGMTVAPKTLSSHIKRLRAKMGDDPAEPSRIVTIRRLGYRYDPVSMP
ncbi:MAG: response regulator transcription factor [Acidimicrobiales bacterium]